MNVAQPSEFLYPRLPRPAARRIIRELSDIPLLELVDLSSPAHHMASPNPVGGKVVSHDRLSDLRHSVRQLAASYNFPLPLSQSRQAAFDRECGTLLIAEMGILTADAGCDDVWSFLALVLLPEVAPWRFPSRNDERQLGGVRNTFQRLWWRAWSLGPDLTWLPAGAMALGEDDYVQIMERPRIGRNSRVAKAIQSEVWETDHAALGITRGVLVRQLTMRVLARRSHISLDALSDQQLGQLVRRVKYEFLAPSEV